jgi:hypothetical protein|tara:strand:- start:703 stop:879 length:177 start_codon:yes stop_codon:yes gene_type:complete
MNIDQVLIEKIKEEFKEKNQSEDLIQEVINLLAKKDKESMTLEEKNIALESILNKIKI